MVATPPRAHKEAIYEQLARIGKAVAAPRRLELLDLLAQAPRTVEALSKQTEMSMANTSQHLRVLRAAGLVDAERNGLYATYRLTTDEVSRFFLALRSLAETRLAEVERVKRQFFASSEDLDPMTGKELLRRVRRGEAIVLDVRPAEEYAAGHIAGAVSMPIGDLKRRLGELPRRAVIVAYGRGPYCVFAIEAVKLLNARGFKATRLADGIPDWRGRGLPVEVGAPEATPWG